MLNQLPVITAGALLDSINPCAISVLLLTLGFLISLEKSHREVLVIAGSYILGIFITYILIGLGVLQALSFFGIPRAITKFGALILICTGVLGLLDRLSRQTADSSIGQAGSGWASSAGNYSCRFFYGSFGRSV